MNGFCFIGIGSKVRVLGVMRANGPLSVRDCTESIERNDFISIGW